MRVLRPAVVLGLILSVLNTNQVRASDAEQATAVETGETGTLVGRVLYDGEPPAPRLLHIPLRIRFHRDGNWFDTEELPERRRVHERGVPDESLIVGEDRGIANVIVWVQSRNVPIPPRRGPFPPATVRAAADRFKPRVLVFWSTSPLVWVNESGAGINFNLSSGIQRNQVLADGQRVEIEVKRPLPLPAPLTSNIQPWFLSHILPLAHPYFAVTGEDGRFAIEDLPTGEWEFRIWHERAGWLATEKTPRGRFKFNVKPGRNDLGDLRVEPQVLAPRRAQQSAGTHAGGKILPELHRAAMEGHPQRVRELIAAGGQVNAREPRFSGTPLHFAARHGHGETVQALLDSGARIAARDTNDCTPLTWAAKGGHSDVMRRLLDAKADVNAQDSRGWTPLHYAIDRGHEEAAQLLLDRGADPLLRNSQGKTAIDLNPDIAVNLPPQ